MTPVEHWARCKPWIEAALARSPELETIADVERAIAHGSYQVWFGRKCCAVTEIAQYARAKALVVVHGGGDLIELLEAMEPRMCDFARAQGCALVMGAGRRGWERAARARGYRFGFVTMVKRL